MDIKDTNVKKSSDEQGPGVIRIKDDCVISTHNKKIIPHGRPVTKEDIDNFLKEKNKEEKVKKTKETKKED